jgi:uncharacterized phage-associated protein
MLGLRFVSCGVRLAKKATVVAMASWFNIRKAAQVAAFFALRQGGQIHVLKLTKLVYLSDRAFMERYDVPITGDKLVSMDHGPVNSVTYNYINGTAEDPDWDAFMADRAGHMVALSRNSITEDELDELSDAELRVLGEVWGRFGHMDRFEIRDWTHKNCPEWDNPHGSSTPIKYSHIFKFLGKPNGDELEDRVLAERRVATYFE